MDKTRSVLEQEDLPAEAISVGAFADEVSRFVNEYNSQFPEYIVGEVSDVSSYSFGTFFDFTDPSGEATLTCIAWSHAVSDFSDDLKPGTTGVVQASLDFYTEKGDLQLNVTNFWPHGESERVEQRAELEATLKNEGLLSTDAKQSLPAYPACIGVVTAHGSSAAEDVRESIRQRDPRAVIKLHDATVQGDNAVPSIVTAVTTLDDDPEVDVIIITRGGGADTTLWSFNEEPLVRCIADCGTPTVAAIGHEDDDTLVEMVADQRCMTPTDAGVTVATDVTQLDESISRLTRRIESAYQDVVTTTLNTVDRRISVALESLVQSTRADYRERQQQIRQVNALEARIDQSYDVLVNQTLTGLSDRIDTAARELKHRIEQQSTTNSTVQRRASDLEVRIDAAYQRSVDQQLTAIESRIEDAYTELEADTQLQSKQTEVQYLRAAVIITLLLLLVTIVLLLL